ncbi:alpha-N-acetylglucosaminidase [Pedobacter sp. PACM 27299]|uniref:alpha-N-acetylglucosaminidase n=1 Tax=Pedobacter sp. PACM 27299 TaxID=1727164 RepID=UPI00070655C9|nr:alpha-N-acetylglucosaminidase [Pedobacter sp. PACM 27299]ALL06091.1 alpha-N-acetylglucosaminidase [Pedobacter sp. PACM 27299]
MKNMIRYRSLMLFLLMLAGLTAKTAPYEEVKGIASRRFSWLAKALVFQVVPAENGKEIFELSSEKGKVIIAASTANAAAEGLNWYLKYYCHRSMSHFGDHLSGHDQGKLPEVKNKVRIVSPYPYRYALNYCTISYSMSFYTWKDWERELDWMALNGVNLMLAPGGMEAVWQNTLRKLGYNEKEITDFVAGPAFGAWWLMGNLQGWGGPVSQRTIDQQVLLQQKIIKRMKQLGMEPVMHGFYGMIPSNLKDKQAIKVIDQGLWAGGFKRPDFLLPEDPYFDKVANIYYSEMKKLYGADLHFFGGDPFHEGGSSKGADLAASGKHIQQVMQQNYPGATWVLQGWQQNPADALLAGLNKEKTLVIELFGENTNNWEKRHGYENTPFVWSNVSNFGEKNGIYGKLQRFADEVYRAKNSAYGPFLKGIGIIPEGIYNNPVAYDLMLELGWHQDHLDLKNWISGYTSYRYGKRSSNMDKAWSLFLETAYSSHEVNQEGPSESIFCARPAIDIPSVSSWGTRKRNYDVTKFEEGVRMFVAAGKEFESLETYQTDRIDFVRQLQANRADKVYAKMMRAIKTKNLEEFKSSSAKFKHLMLQQDSLLSTSKYFSVNRWLQQSLDFGASKSDKENALLNAKTQIIFWGPDNNPKTDLHDYAHKEWSGLLSTIYLSRWEQFIAWQIALMSSKNAAEPDYFKMENEWVKRKDLYPSKPMTKTELDGLIKRIIVEE